MSIFLKSLKSEGWGRVGDEGTALQYSSLRLLNLISEHKSVLSLHKIVRKITQ
jgi:hypothetical protein